VQSTFCSMTAHSSLRDGQHRMLVREFLVIKLITTSPCSTEITDISSTKLDD